MTPDLVEQLRAATRPATWSSRLSWALVPCQLLANAATEIERLRFTRNELLKSVQSIRDNRLRLIAERDQQIAWLRSTNEVLRSSIDRSRRR